MELEESCGAAPVLRISFSWVNKLEFMTSHMHKIILSDSSLSLTSSFTLMQAAKKVYEGLLADCTGNASLVQIQVFTLLIYVLDKNYVSLTKRMLCTCPSKSQMVSLFLMCLRNDFTYTVYDLQYIRFLRRTEGVEAARKYFVDARKSPTCTYHVYVAYAMMAFCLDKEPKVIIFIPLCVSILVDLYFLNYSVLSFLVFS